MRISVAAEIGQRSRILEFPCAFKLRGFLTPIQHCANIDEHRDWEDKRVTAEQILQRAQNWARELHAGQTDKAGQPYIGHVERVASLLIELFPYASIPEQEAAWLHDTIEDCGITSDDMRDRGYTQETIDIVELVTRKPDGKHTFASWIEHIAASGNEGAIRVKIADLTDNLNPRRLAELPPEKAASLSKRYNRALEHLKTSLAAGNEPVKAG